ncbi:tRNA (adenosine(37)-N6)-threonylcarbamoyltransferase complex transferase subunit TsaD [Desertibaculum subflavum]|uniref:tRNA (adenosine(37)-N6)-threonylcarbamoyltransferase complex transferase subunit TsaD n=1 Tax=Desertibaculum subflavum TaxID=2268458 RepID=UPI000E674BDC
MLVLGIETSCDETAAAVVDDTRRIRGERLLSQIDQHRPYLGVVPEIAARVHIEHIDRLIEEAMAEAGLGFADLDAVAATAGPGLIGGLMVGLMTGKAIAAAARKPLVTVNHLEAHALSPRLVADLPFPYLLLLVSGGHCQLLLVDGVGRFRRLGTTIDDAVGEAFDKVAKLLGLGYPGGPAIERAAKTGNPKRFALPRPMLGRPGCHFSFSGLKTAVRLLAAAQGTLDPATTADIAASFQAAVADVLADRTAQALALARIATPGLRHLVVAGGVAANQTLRDRLAALAAAAACELVVPPAALCTDNAAMVAWAGLERLRLGLVDDLAAAPRARWPLDPDAPPAAYAGVKA